MNQSKENAEKALSYEKLDANYFHTKKMLVENKSGNSYQ